MFFGNLVLFVFSPSFQHHSSLPPDANAPAQNLPPLSSAGVHTLPSTSHPNPPQPPPQPPPSHPPPPGGFPSFGAMGGYNPFGMPYFRPVMMGQGLPHLPSHVGYS